MDDKEIFKIVNSLIEITPINSGFGLRVLKKSDLENKLQPLIEEFSNQDNREIVSKEIISKAINYLEKDFYWQETDLQGIDEPCYTCPY